MFFVVYMSKNFVIVDLETTGLSPYKHAITEIAAVRFDGTEIIGEFQSLINPERHIPSFITKLTGISNDMVENSPTILEILPDFLDFLGDDIFVAHNARFDHGFLHYTHFEQKWTAFVPQIICTKNLTKHLCPEIPKRNLSFLCSHFWIQNKRAHRALSDVYATVDLLKELLVIAESQGKTLEDILNN